MGRSTAYDQIDPGEPPVPPSGQALEGVVVYNRHRGRQGRPRIDQPFDEDLVRAVVVERMVKRRPLTEVSAKFGVSLTTVQRWCGELRKDREAAEKPNVMAIREGLSLELEVVAEEAWEIHGTALDSRTKLDALNRIESTIRARALLHGANAPNRIEADVTVTAVTEAERELQAMIVEAKAKRSVMQAGVIATASDDPDL